MHPRNDVSLILNDRAKRRHDVGRASPPTPHRAPGNNTTATRSNAKTLHVLKEKRITKEQTVQQVHARSSEQSSPTLQLRRSTRQGSVRDSAYVHVLSYTHVSSFNIWRILLATTFSQRLLFWTFACQPVQHHYYLRRLHYPTP